MPSDPAGIVAALAAMYPREEIAVKTLDGYVKHLEDINPALLEQAVAATIRTSKWFPTVAEIRQTAAELALQLPRDPEALAQVEERITWARTRAEPTPATEGPAVHPLVLEAVRAVGGFAAFRSTEKPGMLRYTFLQLYGQLRAAQVAGAQVGRLALEEGS